MPIYDYQCPKCEHIELDVVHGMNETPTIKCPKCKHKKMEKQMSLSSVKVKETIIPRNYGPSGRR